MIVSVPEIGLGEGAVVRMLIVELICELVVECVNLEHVESGFAFVSFVFLSESKIDFAVKFLCKCLC